jgi:hypothetical protein
MVWLIIGSFGSTIFEIITHNGKEVKEKFQYTGGPNLGRETGYDGKLIDPEALTIFFLYLLSARTPCNAGPKRQESCCTNAGDGLSWGQR